MIEELSFPENVESDNISSFFKIFATINSNENVFFLLFEFLIQSLYFTKEEIHVFFLIFKNEVISNLIFQQLE